MKIVITGKKEIKISSLLKNLSKIQKISKKIKFQNKKIVGHYETTPFTYKFKRGQIFQHKFINQAKQFNWALKNLPIKNRWVMTLDADE